MRGGGHLTIVPDEPMVEIGQPQELLQVFVRSGCRPFCHHSDLARLCPNFSSLNDVAKKGDRGNMELALLSFHKDLFSQAMFRLLVQI